MKINFKKFFKKMIFILLVLIFIIFAYFFLGKAPEPEKIIWGADFSQKHSYYLGLDWKENYLALLDDLGVKHLKIAAHWDFIEPEPNEYYFDDLDWQINMAEERGAKILLVMGMKTPRWPECHLPYWAHDLPKEKQQESILKMLEAIVLRYKDSQTIEMWQIENEPFFPFGECPWTDAEFLDKEIALVKSLDPSKRPVIISDSGEGSFWFSVAKRADLVGTTMYKIIWIHQLEAYFTYPFPPVFYSRKAKIIETLFGKEVICVELQAEPWAPKLLYDSPLEEQGKTMNLEQFRKNIDFAKRSGLHTFYLWGSEWWYWMKEKHDRPEIWEEAKKLF